jgi:glutamyl-tRNA synthetase
MSSVAPSIVTRFAPSPTGFLHIGGARTALFNYLFARHHGGQFRLRIEDTDRARSTPEAIDAILEGLAWLGLDHDGEVVYQFARAARHAEVVAQLLRDGTAYRCFATADELDAMRAQQKADGLPQRYDGRWRDRDPAEAPPASPFVVRLRAPQSGETSIIDLVQGKVTVQNEQLDDMVLLRSDGTPTYMLAVVVDDHDMGVTHVIRGDDHLNNAFRQLQLIHACGWSAPVYAHIPLIHGPDGAKLSKRHGALAVGEYAHLGYLPEAMENALLRLGWAHGDDEIISRAQATSWFDLAHVGRAAARFDIKKLDHLNAHYMRACAPARLTEMVAPLVRAHYGRSLSETASMELILQIRQALPVLTPRAKTLQDLATSCLFLAGIVPLDDVARNVMTADAQPLLADVHAALAKLPDWTAQATDAAVRQVAEARQLGLGKVAQPLRVALTGTTQAPGIADILNLLGRETSLSRLSHTLMQFAAAA